MNNKKLIFGILLFCAISFLAFTFANPKENEKEDGTLIQNGGSSTTNTTTNKTDKDKVQTPVKVDDSKTDEQKPTDTTTTQTQGSTNNYTASNNNYYTGNNTGNSGNHSSNNGGSGNSGNNNYNPTPTPQPTPNPEPTPSVPDEPVKEHIGIANVSASGVGTDTTVMSGVYASQNGTHISINGTVERRLGTEDGSKTPNITLMLEAPKALENDLLVNAKFKFNSNRYGLSTNEKNVYGRIVNPGEIGTGKVRFPITIAYDSSLFKSEFGNLSISVDWGDGEYTEYTLDFSNFVIKYIFD